MGWPNSSYIHRRWRGSDFPCWKRWRRVCQPSRFDGTCSRRSPGTPSRMQRPGQRRFWARQWRHCLTTASSAKRYGVAVSRGQARFLGPTRPNERLRYSLMWQTEGRTRGRALRARGNVRPWLGPFRTPKVSKALLQHPPGAHSGNLLGDSQVVGRDASSWPYHPLLSIPSPPFDRSPTRS